MTKDAFIREVRDAEAMLYHISKSILKNDSDCGYAVQETILKAYEKLTTLKNGALIIRNSFPQLVDIDNLQAVHFGNIYQWLEVRE